MSTAADLITDSLRLAGVIASGETPTSAEQTDALGVLNDILEEWSNDGFLIFGDTIEDLSLVAGTGSYTIGTGGDFNATRPQFISNAILKFSDNFELPLKIWNKQQWASISLKSTESNVPQGIFYEPSFPLGKVYIWPIPSEVLTLTLYSLKPLSSVAANDTLSYPPGYKKALKYNLTVELCAEFQRPLDPIVQGIAERTRTAISRTNTQEVLLQSDAAELTAKRYYDWRIGE